MPTATDLFPCPLCGSQEGYTLKQGSTFRWWLPTCIGCSEPIGECRAQPRNSLAPIPERSEWGDEEWQRQGRYAERMRRALLAIEQAPDNVEQVRLLAQSVLQGHRGPE